MCQVSSALDNENSTPAELIHAFELVELEIFKLLAYDPFLRFKRQVACVLCGHTVRVTRELAVLLPT